MSLLLPIDREFFLSCEFYIHKIPSVDWQNKPKCNYAGLHFSVPRYGWWRNQKDIPITGRYFHIPPLLDIDILKALCFHWYDECTVFVFDLVLLDIALADLRFTVRREESIAIRNALIEFISRQMALTLKNILLVELLERRRDLGTPTMPWHCKSILNFTRRILPQHSHAINLDEFFDGFMIGNRTSWAMSFGIAFVNRRMLALSWLSSWVFQQHYSSASKLLKFRE